MARFLPLQGASDASAGELPGGIPRREAERKRLSPPCPVGSVQYSAILSSRAARLSILGVVLVSLVSFLREPASAGDTPVVPTGPRRKPRPARFAPASSVIPAETNKRDAKRIPRDSASAEPAADPAAPPSSSLSRGHTPASWPVGPAPLPGSILPTHRIVAFYGNPYSKRMGVLGELPPDSMMAQLRATAAESR